MRVCAKYKEPLSEVGIRKEDGRGCEESCSERCHSGFEKDVSAPGLSGYATSSIAWDNAKRKDQTKKER